MNLRKLFGLQAKVEKPNESSDILHIWEDDYLMIEFLPMENLDFVKKETQRINAFGEEHFDGTGFTDITVIEEKPIKTIDKRILIREVELLFRNTDLQRIEKVMIQGIGLLEGAKAPLAYGSNTFAVLLEGKTDILENIWITGRTQSDADRQGLKQGLQEFGKQFNFIGVNWFTANYFDLNDEKQMNEFINTSC